MTHVEAKGAERPSFARPKLAHSSLADRLALYWSTSRHVDGLWIGAWEDKPEPILRRVEEALSLIKRYDRVRYDRVIRDLQRIWVLVLPVAALGTFDNRIGACKIDTRYLLADTTTPELIASTIVHEATHARLRHRGIGYEEEQRTRIEAICFRREIAFAAKLPSGEAVREQAERSLTLCATPSFWTNEAFLNRNNEAGLEALRYLGTPDWLVRIFGALLRRKRARLKRNG